MILLSLLLLAPAAPPAAPGPSDAPKPVPATRNEVKAALEAHKAARPRLPAPPLDAPGQGPYAKVNNARFRAYYLPATPRDTGFPREPDPAMTLDYPFKVKLFWVVSRVNNCYYCLGHQEHKLLAAGLSDDAIAALDGDWAGLPASEQAALRFARKLALSPHEVGPADVAGLSAHFTPVQVAEIALTVAGYCSTNRWTDGLNIPLEGSGDFFKKGATDLSKYTTPTSPQYADAPSAVGLLAPGATTSCPPAPPARPALESQAEVEARWRVARTRTPVLPLAGGPGPNWERLLKVFPKAGVDRIAEQRSAAELGELPAKVKAEIAWACARTDRAWYALAVARGRLAALGFTEEQMFALDAAPGDLPAGERAAVAFARKLAQSPATVTDADVEGLRKLFPDKQVAEIVYQVCTAAFFNRLTEAAQLPLDD